MTLRDGKRRDSEPQLSFVRLSSGTNAVRDHVTRRCDQMGALMLSW
jgi:hypothetical protein